MASSRIEPFERRLIEEALHRAMSGDGAHAGTAEVFAALDWEQAGVRPGNSPHSVYELLRHMVFWQDWVLEWFGGQDPPLPEHASSSWPDAAAPASAEEWNDAVEQFRTGLEQLSQYAVGPRLLDRDGSRSRLGILHTIASHNSYHAGQVVVVRQMLGAWPPPSGGLTW